MSDDLETIPLDRSEPPPAGPAPSSAPRWRRPSAVATTLGLAAAALVAGWVFSGGSESSSRSVRQADQGPSAAGGEIVCPPGQGLAGTDLGRLGPSRESPEAAVADVAKAFRGHPASGYRYQ
ncbi:MAG: hypothetical protein ACRDYF_10270, partial [Acidimicrobiia bacterium]